MTKEDILSQSIVEGNIIKLPNITLERKLYEEVAKSLKLIGGSWKSNKKGFLFDSDPTDLLYELVNGKVKNLKKEFQFFGTPDLLCDELVLKADINDNDKILEPSAGQGAIIKAINRILPNKVVDCYELMPVNKIFIEKIDTANLLGDDFLLESEGLENTYDKIIANPPFAKNQDIDHVMRMYQLLKSGGKLVTITSTHWQVSNNKKETAFKEWLKTLKYSLEEIPAKSFKESGTNIKTLLLVIYKG